MVIKKKVKKKSSTPKEVPIINIDKKYQAEDDARTLSQAKMIAADRARCNRACAAAKRMAAEKMKEAQAMANIGKSKA